MSFDLHHGDCLEVLRSLPDNSIDSIVTDPPYGLSFMGKKWDYDVPSVEVWAECLRVLKPGGHLLAFAGTRTQHRMAVRIKDAGFEIRDMIAWVYGSGFPKSMDVSKAIDKRKDWKALAELGKAIKAARVAAGLSQTEAARLVGLIGLEESLGGGGFMWFETGRLPTRTEWPLLKQALRLGDAFDAAFEEAEREVIGVQKGAMSGWDVDGGTKFVDRDITAPATDAARQWQGWGTALKPALEPITVARKPLIGTVAENVLEYSTGALNIDGCRVGDEVRHAAFTSLAPCHGNALGAAGTAEARRGTQGEPKEYVGRFPANLIHDGSDEVVALFPDSKGQQGAVTGEEPSSKTNNVYGQFDGRPATKPRGDNGSAARFFYAAKASKKDRGEGNNHPTVKPIALCRYLLRLVTPPGGKTLDPYAGSGSFGVAAIEEGFYPILIEKDEDENGEPLGYIDIINYRIGELVFGELA